MSREPWRRESEAILQRIFSAAAQRAGGEAALARHLELHLSELRTYLSGEAMPPEDMLLRTADLVVEEVQSIRPEFSDQAWLAERSHARPTSGAIMRAAVIDKQ